MARFPSTRTITMTHSPNTHDLHGCGYRLQEESPVIYRYLELYSMVHPVTISSYATRSNSVYAHIADYAGSKCNRLLIINIHGAFESDMFNFVIALYSRLYVLGSRLATIQPTCVQRMTCVRE